MFVIPALFVFVLLVLLELSFCCVYFVAVCFFLLEVLLLVFSLLFVGGGVDVAVVLCFVGGFV